MDPHAYPMPILTPYLFTCFEAERTKQMYLYVSIKTPTGFNVTWKVMGHKPYTDPPSVGVPHYYYVADVIEDNSAMREEIRTYRFEIEGKEGDDHPTLHRFFFHVDINDNKYLEFIKGPKTGKRKCGVSMVPKYTK